MTIKVFCNAFPAITIKGIDMSTFNFYGPTNGYDASDKKDCSTIGFVINDIDNSHAIVNAIKETFKLNPEYAKVEDYIWVRTDFPDYKTDKRPRIGIRINNGLRGMTDAPSFEFTND